MCLKEQPCKPKLNFLHISSLSFFNACKCQNTCRFIRNADFGLLPGFWANTFLHAEDHKCIALSTLIKRHSYTKAFCEFKILAHDFFPIMPMILALNKNDIVLLRPVDVSVKIQCDTLVKYLVQHKVRGSEILGKNATSKLKNVLLLCPKSRK